MTMRHGSQSGAASGPYGMADQDDLAVPGECLGSVKDLM